MGQGRPGTGGNMILSLRHARKSKAPDGVPRCANYIYIYMGGSSRVRFGRWAVEGMRGRKFLGVYCPVLEAKIDLHGWGGG